MSSGKACSGGEADVSGGAMKGGRAGGRGVALATKRRGSRGWSGTRARATTALPGWASEA